MSIAHQHANRSHYAEAAQCMLHCAALVNEYLTMKDSGLPGGASAFSKLSVNIDEESAVSDDVIGPEEEGICESSHFTVSGLIHLIERTVEFYDKAGYYENVQTLYEVRIVIFACYSSDCTPIDETIL